MPTELSYKKRLKNKKAKEGWIRETPNGANPVTLSMNGRNPVKLLGDGKTL
jgi:hypothetical protein